VFSNELDNLVSICHSEGHSDPQFGKRSAAISSVAVLPFANQSGDPHMDYLSDGLSESLINSLSQLPSLKVISRSSAFKYKGKEIDPQQVARDLGVQAIGVTPQTYSTSCTKIVTTIALRANS